MLELFTYRLGRTLEVPLLDPFNAAYRSRVEAVAELIRPVVENWESFRDALCHSPESVRDELEEIYLEPELDRPQHVGYMIRKLAEMLSGEEVETLGRQLFLKEARALSRSAFCDPCRSGFESWRHAEQAMKIVYDGFAAIQGRLDLGLDPFTDGDGIELLDEKKPLPVKIPKILSEGDLVRC